MKRFTTLSFSLSAVLLCQPVWAQEAVYCPQEVNCAQEGPSASCSFDQHQREYWNDTIVSSNPQSVLAGHYRLSYVSASYQSRGPSYPICVYTHADVYSTVSILGKPESNLERYDSPDWRAEEFWWECKPSSAESCPLFEQDALYVKNMRKYPISVTPGKIKINAGKYTRLFADDFNDCPNLDACIVEIYTEEEQAGMLTLNLEHHMNIVDIVDNIDVRSEIVQLGEFNAVEVK